MRITAKSLVDALFEMVQQHIHRAEEMAEMSEEDLNRRPGDKAWSALECIQHLNLYGVFYIQEIRNQIDNNSYPKSAKFNSGWWGDYFARSMMPRVEGMTKMKTFPNKNPLGSQLNKGVITEFIQQQKEMLSLLESAENVNLSKIKTGMTISKHLRLRLGDALRIVIYHNHRHLKQAEMAIGLY